MITEYIIETIQENKKLVKEQNEINKSILTAQFWICITTIINFILIIGHLIIG